MPKPTLTPELMQLENDIITTMEYGLSDWRPDLKYPESYSDMQACVRSLLVMYEVKRRPVAKPLQYNCYDCEGLGALGIRSG